MSGRKMCFIFFEIIRIPRGSWREVKPHSEIKLTFTNTTGFLLTFRIRDFVKSSRKVFKLTK